MSEVKSKIDFRALVCISIGDASVCWDNFPRGVFNSTRARELADEICVHYDAAINKLGKLQIERDEARAKLVAKYGPDIDSDAAAAWGNSRDRLVKP